MRRLFDKKFGLAFLAGVPTAPGVYRFLDEAGALLYVGKAGSLRRRLAHYRAAGRRKKERKRRALVKAAATITWEVCESSLAASLAEIRLIDAPAPAQCRQRVPVPLSLYRNAHGWTRDVLLPDHPA